MSKTLTPPYSDIEGGACYHAITLAFSATSEHELPINSSRFRYINIRQPQKRRSLALHNRPRLSNSQEALDRVEYLLPRGNHFVHFHHALV